MKALLLLLLHFLLASLAHCSSGKKIRWCTLSEAEQRKCSDLSRALVAILTLTDTTAFGRVSCIRMRNTRNCVDKIRANKADAASLDAGDVYSGANLHGLTVAAKEVYAEGNCVFAVAVVRRGTPRNIHALKGSRSCHNGARWTSGWSIPLGFLLSSGDLVWDKDQPLRRAVADYFNASCVPGAGDPRLCALCRGVKSYLLDRNHFCETNGDEPFYDSEGAFRCLASGAADVAFLDHLAIVNASESDQESFALLCADGSTAPLTDYTTCNLGRGPGRAIVTRRSFRKIAVKFITVVQELFGTEGTEKARFELFASSAFQGTDLLFRDATRHLHPVVEDADISHVLGADYVTLLQGLGHEGSALSNSVIRWCCISDAEIRKCEEWALNVRSDPLVCVQADSMAGCIERIKKNEADAIAVDATRAFFAAACALVPAAVENYEPETLYAVALAKKDAKNVNLRNLRGKRSCHGCKFCPAGWLLLSRFTIGAAPENGANCNLTATYQDFFWKGCMPGADGNLCKVCVGQNGGTAASASEGVAKCAANHAERYYGNLGALRCLLGDVRRRNYGDVAFVEHHGLLRNLERLSVPASDFELLCPNGSRAAILDWRECNLGRVPPGVVVTRPMSVAKVHGFLEKSQDAGANSDFHLFRSEKYGEGDLLFKDATRRITLTRNMDYRVILGEDFFRLAESVFHCNPAGVLDFCRRDPCADI